MAKKLHLHLDADTSSKALYNALLERGHDLTRTPTEWMPFDASDEQQLLGATAQGRAIFTYNIPRFYCAWEALSSARWYCSGAPTEPKLE